MPIISSELEFRLSGGSGNSSPAASIGGAKSSVAVDPATLFDLVSGAESAAGLVDYRCIYLHNADPALTALGAKVWIVSNTPSADTAFAIALGGEGLNGTAETPANDTTAPSGESFVAAANEGAALSMGDIPTGQHYPIWIRRTVTAGASAYTADGITLRVKCDTAA
jgi:hypothetical protein